MVCQTDTRLSGCGQCVQDGAHVQRGTAPSRGVPEGIRGQAGIQAPSQPGSTGCVLIINPWLHPTALGLSQVSPSASSSEAPVVDAWGGGQSLHVKSRSGGIARIRLGLRWREARGRVSPPEVLLGEPTGRGAWACMPGWVIAHTGHVRGIRYTHTCVCVCKTEARRV